MKNDNLDEYDKKEQSEQAFIGYEEQSRYLYSFEGPQVSPSLALSDNDRSAIMAQPTSHPHQPSAVQVDKAIRISSDSSLLSGLKMCSTTSQVLAILREAVLSLSENNRRLQDRLSQVSGSAQLQMYQIPAANPQRDFHTQQYTVTPSIYNSRAV
ncbi:hypothetical protein GUITHDRAFT_148338 [Guillardia theta CCMP2712]|uniref:Uncharacterized protein n=1 Tax=Guillardia theta (strain CCMP2712) TaxID=905079 RepID=L1IAE2_GUITC|nr:hypothetical protein GUITHDRAFT_148338 [Guillardia theta CCMP2712]EKX32859.1 hypothetical protein GUITHDRAFT_148338 [Guillardia theta CCMP2712]|eukprot:XP_005819839.1 hypothetical protein GUITHDRAFT_148338 [Guillardia theta CCMP2712]